MYKEVLPISCSIIRGGTSKGIYLMENDLPQDKKMRDKIILSIFGSPDVRQIDGLGGADTLTSKVAIIGPSTREDADIDYTFGQVSMTAEFVDYKGNCGNISAGVGAFAIDKGLIKAEEPITKVRIHLTNTDNIVIAEIPAKNGKASVEGDFEIDGVPGTGAKVVLDWADTQGAITGKLLPTGNVKDRISANGREYTVSIVDIANPLVFIKAQELGIKGTETPEEIDENKDLLKLIEEIRGKCAEKINMISDYKESKEKSPYIPFFAIVSEPYSHKTFNGKNIKKEDIDIVSRLLFMQKMHKAYPGTGTICTGVACRINGTIVNDISKNTIENKDIIRIGHPSGIIETEAEIECNKNKINVNSAKVYRTARLIMEGKVYIRQSLLNKLDE